MQALGCLFFLVLPLVVFLGLYGLGLFLSRSLRHRLELNLYAGVLAVSSCGFAWARGLGTDGFRGEPLDVMVCLPTASLALGWIWGWATAYGPVTFLGLGLASAVVALGLVCGVPVVVTVATATVAMYVGLNLGHLPLRVILVAAAGAGALCVGMGQPGLLVWLPVLALNLFLSIGFRLLARVALDRDRSHEGNATTDSAAELS